MIEEHLKTYNINFQKHIVYTVSDGPNVMKAFIKLIPVPGIFCLNHAIHLAVLNVIYKKIKNYLKNQIVRIVMKM